MKESAREAVIFLGGVMETARRMEVSPTAVRQWMELRVPAERVLQLEAELAEKLKDYQSLARKPITRHHLRPDIYPET